MVAEFLIGTIELLGLLPSEMAARRFWTFMANFNINTAGFIIVGMFAVTWLVALAVWRFGQIEQEMGRGRLPSTGRRSRYECSRSDPRPCRASGTDNRHRGVAPGK